MSTTITHELNDGREVRFDFMYYPGEPSTWTHPGCPDEIEVSEARIVTRDAKTGAVVDLVDMEEEDFDAVRAELETAVRDFMEMYHEH